MWAQLSLLLPFLNLLLFILLHCILVLFNLDFLKVFHSGLLCQLVSGFLSCSKGFKHFLRFESLFFFIFALTFSTSLFLLTLFGINNFFFSTNFSLLLFQLFLSLLLLVSGHFFRGCCSFRLLNLFKFSHTFRAGTRQHLHFSFHFFRQFLSFFFFLTHSSICDNSGFDWLLLFLISSCLSRSFGSFLFFFSNNLFSFDHWFLWLHTCVYRLDTLLFSDSSSYSNCFSLLHRFFNYWLHNFGHNFSFNSCSGLNVDRSSRLDFFNLFLHSLKVIHKVLFASCTRFGTTFNCVFSKTSIFVWREIRLESNLSFRVAFWKMFLD